MYMVIIVVHTIMVVTCSNYHVCIMYMYNCVCVLCVCVCGFETMLLCYIISITKQQYIVVYILICTIFTHVQYMYSRTFNMLVPAL